MFETGANRNYDKETDSSFRRSVSFRGRACRGTTPNPFLVCLGHWRFWLILFVDILALFSDGIWNGNAIGDF